MFFVLAFIFGDGTNMHHIKMQSNRKKESAYKKLFFVRLTIPRIGRWAGRNAEVKPGGESCILFTRFSCTMGERINPYQPSSNVTVNKNVLFYYFGGEGTQ